MAYLCAIRGTPPPSPREANSRGSSPAVGRFAPSGLPSLFPRLIEMIRRRGLSARVSPDLRRKAFFIRRAASRRNAGPRFAPFLAIGGQFGCREGAPLTFPPTQKRHLMRGWFHENTRGPFRQLGHVGTTHDRVHHSFAIGRRVGRRGFSARVSLRDSFSRSNPLSNILQLSPGYFADQGSILKSPFGALV